MKIPSPHIMNLTTGRMFTKIEDVFDTLKLIIGRSINYHQLPCATDALRPLLRRQLPAELFDTDLCLETLYHPDKPSIIASEYAIRPLTPDEQIEWQLVYFKERDKHPRVAYLDAGVTRLANAVQCIKD